MIGPRFSLVSGAGLVAFVLLVSACRLPLETAESPVSTTSITAVTTSSSVPAATTSTTLAKSTTVDQATIEAEATDDDPESGDSAPDGEAEQESEGDAEPDLRADAASEDRSVSFQSPSGNIHCRIDRDTAGCAYIGQALWEQGGDLPLWADGSSFEFEPAGCSTGGFAGMAVDAADPGDRSDRVRSVCTAEPYLAEEPSVTLPYGSEVVVGELSCASTEVGVACRHRDGRGFVVSYRELSLLLGPGNGWKTAAVAQARDLASSGGFPISVEEAGGSALIATDGAVCWLAGFAYQAECDSTVGRVGVGWTPDAASCEGADYNGMVISAPVEGANVSPTLGCTTDLSPLADPTVGRIPVFAGQLWSNGPDLTCGSPDSVGLVCWNSNGDGIHLTDNEMSLFYNAFG